MQILTIDKSDFLRGFSTGKNVNDGGFSPESLGFEVDRMTGSYFGMLQAGRTLTDSSTNIADNIMASYPYYTGGKHYYYEIGNAGKIYQTDISAATHTVKATESVKTYDSNSDIIIYAGGLFITSTTDIYYDDLSFTVNDHDWLTNTQGASALTSGVPHKLFKFQGNLYITNGNKIIEWDGTTLTQAKLTLEAGWIITDVAIDGRLIYITASYSVNNYDKKTESRIFVWNSYSNNWEREIPVDAPHMGAIIKVDVGFVFFGGQSLYYLDGYNYSWRKYIGYAPTFNRAKVHNGIVYFITTSGIAAYNWRMNALTHPVYTAITLNNFNIAKLDNIDIFAETNKFYRANSNNGISTFYSNWYDLGMTRMIRRIEVLLADSMASGADYQFDLYDETDALLNEKVLQYAVQGAKQKITWAVNKEASGLKCSLLFNNAANKPLKYIRIYHDRAERNTNK